MRILSLALFAALLLPFSGCDSVGVEDGHTEYPCTYCDDTNGGNTDGPDDGDSTDGGSSGAQFVELDPRATYLRVSQDPAEDGAIDATAFRLSDLKLTPGDAVCFRAQGDFLYADGARASERMTQLVTAVFSVSDVLGDRKERLRVHDAVDAGSDVVTLDTFLGGQATDIEEDFDATDACVTIPSKARYVFFSAVDDNFNDNADARDNDQPFGVRIEK